MPLKASGAECRWVASQKGSALCVAGAVWLVVVHLQRLHERIGDGAHGDGAFDAARDLDAATSLGPTPPPDEALHATAGPDGLAKALLAPAAAEGGRRALLGARHLSTWQVLLRPRLLRAQLLAGSSVP